MPRYPSTPACRFHHMTAVPCLLVLSVVACSHPERTDKNASGFSLQQAERRPTIEATSTNSSNPSRMPQSLTSASPMTNDLEGQLKDAIKTARIGGKGQVIYASPTTEQMLEYRNFVSAGLARHSFSSLPVPPQFDIRTVGEEYELLRETPTAKRGAGIVVLRKSPSARLCIEVPHSFFDEGTLDIGLQLFLQSNAHLLLVNTAHRYRTTNDLPPKKTEKTDKEDLVSSDVAHAARSFFLAAHEAVADTIQNAVTVQVHGYANVTAPDFDIIVSAARTKTSITNLVKQLRDTLRFRAARYPDDIRQLGGTTNVEAKYSRSKGACFVHLELSETLRNRLIKERHLMTQFAALLEQEARCD